MTYEKEIKAYAIKNALDYGKAEPSKILPKMFRHGLEKKEISKVMPIITKICEEINLLSKSELEKEIKEIDKVIVKKEQRKKTLIDNFPKARGDVITRMAPEPSKHAHLGHAMSFIINYLFAKQNNGKCFLRFDDCNPEKIKFEYVESIKEDIENYLGIKYDETKFVSDEMPYLYKKAKELIEKDYAYMCFCDREKISKLRREGKGCSCRKNEKLKNLEEWQKFLKGDYIDGECILRFKGNMKNKNSVMRDPVLFRALKGIHYRHKEYKVWPVYDFYSPLMDAFMKISHVFRTKEFDLRLELQKELIKIFNLKEYTAIHYGRFNVLDACTKGREIREMIEKKEISGWDDPRLMTLKALRRRGIKKEVIYELVNEVGLSKYDVNLDFDKLASISRKLFDKEVRRYYFVQNPVEIDINNLESKDVEIPIQPGSKETRRVKAGKIIIISTDDFDKNKNKEVRLLHLCNIKLGSNIKEKNICKYTSKEIKKIPKIQWVSSPYSITAKIMMPNGSWVNGKAEENISDLEKGDFIQFERVGFVRFDKINDEGEYEFRFAHK